MAIILAIAIAVSAVASYSAEGSLPGYFLYPVKTEVNERVKGWAAISAEAESEHQADLALRRLEEAERLEAEGRLDAETKAELETEFRLHTREAGEELQELESKGDEEKAASIRASLDAAVQTKGGVLGIVDLGGMLGANVEAGVKTADIKTEQGNLKP